MTSGQFHRVEISSILVDRDRRQRREIEPAAIDELADSIRRLGLIHPPVITRELTLVSGERRLLSCKRLGWTHISVQFTDELEPSQLKAIELEENIKRRDLPWQDQVSAIRDFHLLMKVEKPEWRMEETADEIGLSRQYVGRMLAIAEEVAQGNQRVAAAPKLSVAHGIVQRKRERENANVYFKIHESFPLEEAPEENVMEIDFHEWVKGHMAPRFNFIHCDFPYGIRATEFDQSATAGHGTYDDSPEVWLRLMDSLEEATRKAITPSCHLMFWFAMRKVDQRLYEPTARRLEKMGWDINPLPLIWFKSDLSGIIPDPERGPRQVYETCLFGTMGDRKIVRPIANLYACPSSSNKFHTSEKPEPMLRHFFQMFVDENTVMLDPTCGAGSALRAADSMGAKFILGLELDSEYAKSAHELLKRERTLRLVGSR